MKATSGYVFTLGGGAVSWKSCKQTILTRSTMEAELTALDTSCIEAEWLRELLMDLPMVDKLVSVVETSSLAAAHISPDPLSFSLEP